MGSSQETPRSEETHRAGERRWLATRDNTATWERKHKGRVHGLRGGGNRVGGVQMRPSVGGCGLTARDRVCWKWSNTAIGLRILGTTFHL